MSIRPVLRAVIRPSAESAYLRSLEEQTPRVRVSGTCRIAVMYLEGPGFMQRDEFPPNLVLRNSEGHKGRKGPGCWQPRRKGKLSLESQGGVPYPAYSTVTMTPNDKAVKRKAGWFYSPSCREEPFSETRIHVPASPIATLV